MPTTTTSSLGMGIHVERVVSRERTSAASQVSSSLSSGERAETIAVRRERTKTMEAAAPSLVRSYPMFVLPIDEVLALDRMKPHEELEDVLVEWDDGMGDVLFVSHTWLGYNHPDPEGCKLTLLQTLLRRMRSGTLSIGGFFFASVLYSRDKLRLSAATLSRCQYVWLDYASVPQVSPGAQGRAIASIFSYVNSSTVFIVLAGAWKHENGSVRDARAWMSRGWCRLEQLANVLSPVVKPIILAQSSQSVLSHGPGGLYGRLWYSEPVGEGAFTVEADRQALGPVIAAMLEARKALALQQREWHAFRVIDAVSAATLRGTSVTATPTGQWSAPSLSHRSRGSSGAGGAEAAAGLEAWLSAMHFATKGGKPVAREGQSSGWTPLMYAVLASQLDTCAALIAHGADVNRPLRSADVQFGLTRGATPLHLASVTQDAPELASLLLSHGADPDAFDRSTGMLPAHYAAGFGRSRTLRVLLDHVGREAIHVVSSFGFHAISSAAIAGRASLVRELLLADGSRTLAKTVDGHGATLCKLAVSSVGDVETLRAVLEAGCEPDRVAPPTNRRFLNAMRVFDLALRLLPRPDGFIEFFSYATRCSPLHTASYHGNLGAVELLLQYGADPNTTSHRLRATPLHLASLDGHRAVVETLLAAGARTDVADRRGRTPVDWARRRGHPSICAALCGERGGERGGGAVAAGPAGGGGRSWRVGWGGRKLRRLAQRQAGGGEA